MSRVVLISPPFRQEYMRNARCDFVSLSKSSWYPIWLGQAGAYLEGKGHQTKMVDAQVNGISFESSLEDTANFKPDLVAIYSGRLSEDSDIRYAEELEKKGFKTVFVGPYASIDPVGLLKRTERAKLLIQREFDLPLEELASGKSLKEISNLVFKEEGEPISNSIRPLYKTEILDTFPITSAYFHKQVDIYRYKTPSELYPFIDVMSGRGCAWGRCNFCLWVQTFVPGSVYNLRSIDHFMQEFEYISRFMPEIKGVMIQDDMLTNARAIAISEGLLKRNLKFQWSCYAKPNSNLTKETLSLMKKSGCLNLHVGFESGDNEVLKKIDKGSTVEQAKEFARMAHAAGLQIHGDFALGHLGETKESARKTVALAKEIQAHSAQFQVMIPFRKTKFWNQLAEKNLWAKTGEPSYETVGGLNSEQIRAEAKRAYRSYYISWHHFKRILKDPKNELFLRMDQYVRAIPSVFWKRWEK
jgi:anaerobic magnesium-protoporphyrin IX monomethyl ester cyclase